MNIMPDSFAKLEHDIIHSTACPRLTEWCQHIAKVKKKAFADWDYFGKPVPGFGDPKAAIWILGLAPAAHGANRTGRMFTGDRSGDFLFAALHRVGLSNKPVAIKRDDGLKLTGCYISSSVRWAPPKNKPTVEEIAANAPFLDREWKLLTHKRIILALGKLAWDAALRLIERQEITLPKPRPKFTHGAAVELGPITLVGSYHVSQQNTFTGTLTEKMFDDVLRQCIHLSKK